MLFDWIASGIVPENAADLLNGSFDEVISFFLNFSIHYACKNVGS